MESVALLGEMKIILRGLALPNGKRNGTQEAQSGHKKHKKEIKAAVAIANLERMNIIAELAAVSI